MNIFEHIHGAQAAHSEPNGSMGRWAKMYDTLGWFWFLGREKAFRKQMLDIAQVKPGQQVLDVGSGTGTLALLAQQRLGPAGQANGIDVAKEMVEVASNKAARTGSKARFQVSPIQELPFPDGSLDVVLSSFMIHHLPGEEIKRKGMQEVFRVLKPGGCFLIVDFEPPKSGPYKVLFSSMFGQRMMGIDNSKLPSMLAEAGFTNLQTGPVIMPAAMYFKVYKP